MPAGYELVHRALYFHCGWGIEVEPSFKGENVHGGRTLRMVDEARGLEISLSSMALTRTDGKPVTADEFLDGLPIREMAGLHFEHEAGSVKGRALWMFGESDTDGPAWVLAGFTVSQAARKMAQCTIVCRKESDKDWALETWRSIALCDRP